jgi:hypothetical protein
MDKSEGVKNSVKLDYLIKLQEERQLRYKEDREQIIMGIARHTLRLEEQANRIDSIEKSLKQQRGFLAGVIFVVSGIWGVLTVFKAALVKAIVGH